MTTESQQYAEDYLDFAEEDELSGTSCRVDENQIVIYQELDDEDEADKYYVIKADVDPNTWELFRELALSLSSVRV